MTRRISVVLIGLALLLPGLGMSQVRGGASNDVDHEKYPPEVLEKYWECMERTDLDKIQELTWYHNNVEKIDASVYGLPKNDFDDRSLLTIEERLEYRAERAEVLSRRPDEPRQATSGSVQYPHYLREAYDHYYETTGQRPDCSKILEDAGIPAPPRTIESSWATDYDLTTADTNDRGEVNVAIDHANENNIMASSCPSGSAPDSSSNFISATSDWGQSWSYKAVGNNSGSTWECDPVSYYQTSTGRVYHSKIGCNNGFCSSTYVMMRYSSDNGSSWSDCGRPGSNTAEDRQWHVVDNDPSSACYGNIYITWHNTNQEKVNRSTDSCANWDTPTNLTGTNQAITPDINVAADGHVYVVWQNHGDNTFKIAGSNDCGATWASPSPKTLTSRNGDWTNNLISQCQRGVAAQPYVDVDRASSSPFYGRVYVMLAQFNNSCSTESGWSCSQWDSNWNSSCNYDLFLMYSDNNGASFSSPVNITSGDGNNVDNFMGYMRVDPVDGSIWLSYHRSTLNPTSASDRQKTRYVVKKSKDGGSTWEDMTVASVDGDERASGANTFERGDYNGLDAYNGVAWPLWIDRRGGGGEENVIVRKVCSEPAHWSERGTSPSAPTLTMTSPGAGTVDISWTAPDVYWGDGDEDNSQRKYQLWVDGSLVQDNIAWTTTSISNYDPGDCDPHNYFIRAINQCGISKDYATKNYSATGCCTGNPTVVDVTPDGPLTLCAGTAQTLTAGYSGGSSPYTFQWYRDGSIIPGATSSTYSANDTGTHSYNCEVSGGGCSPGIQDSTATQITWQSEPSFGGLQSVAADVGGGCSLHLEWTAASSVCSSAPSIVYDVYRSTSSGFTPASGNLLASCVSDLYYDDSSAVSGTTYYYIVRAEDSSVGHGGSCNGGYEESNTAEVSGAPGGGTTTLYSEDFDAFAAGASADWAHGIFAGSDFWVDVRACTPNSSPNIYRYGPTSCTGHYFSNSDALAYPMPTGSPISVPAGATDVSLSFAHNWNFATGDGGSLWISSAAIYPTFQYIGASYLSGQGYNGTANGNDGFTGSSGGFASTQVDLSKFCTDDANFAGDCAGEDLYLAFDAFSNVMSALYDQSNTPAGGKSCQDFEATYNSYDAEGAADFVVPAGGWVIERIDIPGSYSTSGPLDSLDLVIYSDSGGFPGSVVCSNMGINGTDLVDSSGDLQATLSTACDLPAGTYWLAVQGNMDYASGGQWYWEMDDVQSTSYGGVWRNPGDGFGTGCTSWTYLTTCDSTSSPDYVFSLYGHEAATGWNLDDVVLTYGSGTACTAGAPDPVEHLTARANSGAVKLEWVNSSTGYASTRICRDTSAFPSDPATCTQVHDAAGTAGAYDSFTDSGVANGTTYYYTAWVNNGSGTFSTRDTVTARPFATTGKTQWAYSSGASALAPNGVYPGAIGSGATFAVSNDRVLHGMNPTTAGGDWPRTSPYAWKPMAMNGPAQARPPVVPTSAVSGADMVVFLGSEDGHAYAANAKTGTTLWQSSALGSILLASPAGMFTAFGGSYDLVFIGSRDAGSGNSMYGLNASDGTTAWTFDNGGGANAIGIISSSAYVDYANNRLYFAGRENASGSNSTMWCLSLTGSSSVSLLWSRALGDIDGAPTLYDGVVYVGNNAGEVFALDPATGATKWSYATGDGAVKGYVYPQFQAVPRDVYFSTSGSIWALTDSGSSVSLDWQQGSIPSPSVLLAVPGGTDAYVGASDGKLYQLSISDGGVATSLTIGDGTATVGSPVMDVINNMFYVGTESGAVYGVNLPLN